MDERLMKRCIGLSVPEWDMAHRLPINRLVGPDMWDSGTIFRFNSAYMDVTDQSFMEKQWMMGAALIASIAIGCGLFFLALFMSNPHAPLFLYAIPAVFIGVFGFLLIRFGRGVMFSLTRMPIRFHRKARKLFAVRGRRYFGAKSQGDQVWEIPWNEQELFCLHKEVTQFGTVYHIRHYALDAEGKVARVFSIGREWTGTPEIEILLAQWNYWCTFMNEGPQALPKPMLFHTERETPRESFLYSLYGFGLTGSLLWRLITMPLVLIFTPLRMLAIATSRAPIWPESIEEISQIDPNDAYAEPRRGTPVGWAETVLAQQRKEYPDAPQRKTDGWSGIKDGVENANQWALDQPPKNLAGG
jgi:hypothetical protein